MKVADLFGAGVPVCALDYGACLAERVRHGDNGLLFSTACQLADVLFDLFETFPADQSSLERLRTGARQSARPTWEEGWVREAKPVLCRLAGPYNGSRSSDGQPFTRRPTLDNFIGGRWVGAHTTDFFDVRNPAVGDVIGRTPLSTAADVDAAVQAATRRVSRLARHAGQRARAGALPVQGAARSRTSRSWRAP